MGVRAIECLLVIIENLNIDRYRAALIDRLFSRVQAQARRAAIATSAGHAFADPSVELRLCIRLPSISACRFRQLCRGKLIGR
jgi:hypothetical protein